MLRALPRLITRGKGRAYNHKEFDKTMPSFYDGTPHSDIVEGWIWKIKKKMNALNALVYFRYGLVVYKPSRKADYWWKVMSRGRDIEATTCEEFKKMFYNRFFNKNANTNEVVEFMNLKQEDMIVA